MTEPTRVLFAGGGTGGHLYPALALADAFQERSPDVAVLLVGARRGIEARVLPERGLPHELLPFEPIRRARPWENWRLLFAMGGMAVGIARIFRRFRPHLVVGTGGYASGPVVAWAVMRGLPTAIQEQNSYPGLTTRWLAARVDQVHLAFPEALRHLRPGKRTRVYELGNPIAPPRTGFTREAADRSHFGLGNGRVALIVGGSQGARAVNEALLADLAAVAAGTAPPRPEGLELLWATGPANYERVEAEINNLGLESWVHALPYIHEMPRALSAADLAVSRAGAMALAELCAWGVPSVLVPFPHAAANHQYHNALALAEAGAAVMITEQDLRPGRLWNELVGLGGDDARRNEIATRARERGRPDAARLIVEKLSELVSARRSTTGAKLAPPGLKREP